MRRVHTLIPGSPCRVAQGRRIEPATRATSCAQRDVKSIVSKRRISFDARKRSVHSTLACLLAVLIAIARPALADGAPVQVLRIGTSGDYAPFSIATDAEPAFRGLDIAVAEAFAHEHGYTIEWVPFVWRDLSTDFKAGRFDVVMSGVTVRADRSALGRFSVPVMNSGAVLIYRTQGLDPEQTPAVTLGDFNQARMRIAVNQGGHLERVTRAHFQHATIMPIADNGEVRQQLIDGHADAIVTDTLEAPHWLHGLTRAALLGPWTQDRKAYWFRSELADLARRFDAWMLAREADGTLANLRREAVGNQRHLTTAEPVNALLAAMDERLTLMPWVAESKRAGGIAIEDLEQEQRVLEVAVRKVNAAADRRRREPPTALAVRDFYRAQITAAKHIQRATLVHEITMTATAADLSSVLRPALMRIGERIAELVVTLGRLHEPADLAQYVSLAVHERGLSSPIVSELTRTMAALFSTARVQASP